MDLQKIEGAKYGDIIDDNKPKLATMTKIISNPETGESIENEYNISYKTQIPIGSRDWLKLFNSSLTKVGKPSYLGYIYTLALNFLEYETNRLMIKGTSSPAKKDDFIRVLDSSDRSMSRFLSYCKKSKAIIKFKGWYYISPLICLKGKFISTDTVKIFLKEDPSIRSAIKNYDLMMIGAFEKLMHDN